MKKYRFLIAALAAGMFTACSDNTDVNTDTGGAAWNADGTGYVSLSINLPTAMSDSRAGSDNDTFENGTADEYAVKDATLILFAGADEASATFQGAYKLAVPTFFDNTAQQITSTAQITRKIKQVDATQDNIYAYVALNATSNNLFTLTNTNDTEVVNTGLTVGNTELTGTTTFKTFQALTANIPTTVANGLLMVNAPLANNGSTGDVAGGAAATAPEVEVQTLAEVNTHNIKQTQHEAAAAPAATIYVERAVAKVEFQGPSGTNLQVTDSPTSGRINYEILGYRLDNTNSTSFITRNADATAGTDGWAKLRSNAQAVKLSSTGFRFVGNSAVTTDSYRTYWAVDPNYNVNATNLTTSTAEGTIQTATNGVYPVSYCMENTFDVERMTRRNTTRMIVKVRFWTDEADKGNSYWMYGNNMSTYKTEGDAFNTAALATINNIASVKAYFNGKQASQITYADTQNGKEVASVTFGTGVDAITISANSVPTELPLFNEIKNYFGTISVYTNGIGYYQVRIKHFGDDLTPWNGTGNKTEWSTQPSTWNGTDISTIYPGDAATQNNNYLGRYGVVRNNWYKVAVSSVKRIGTSDIPPVEDDDTPDDELESYISVNINILPWAVRTQSEVLQ